MGYVNDANMCKWIPPSQAKFSAGTWTDVVNSNVWSKYHTPADESFYLSIPLPIWGNAKDLKGVWLKSIDVYWDVNVSANDALDATLYLKTLPINTALPTAAAVTTSYDTAHDAANERDTQDEHKMTLTLSTPVWVDEDHAYTLSLLVNASADCAFFFFGARANYTLRV